LIQVINSAYPLLPLLQFCQHATTDSRPNAVNMDPIDWENKPHTFLYLLYKERRFDGPKAGYVIYIKGKEIVAGIGWYPSDWDDNIYVQCRAYTVPGTIKGLGMNSTYLTNDLTYFMEDVTISQGYKGCCQSVEKYNKKLIDSAIKINDPKRYPLYHKITMSNGIVTSEYREPGVRMRERKYAGLYNIKNTEQHVMYFLYDPAYEKELLRKLNEKTN